MFKIEVWNENDVLRAIAPEVTREELKEVVKVWKDMVHYIKNPANGWVGLAAPQIGLSKRLIVVSLMSSYDDEYYSTVMMINPKILEYSNETDLDVEGCLSVPWKQAKIERSLRIKLEFLDQKGFKNTMTLNWLAARIVQHEYDHLNGILLIDRINQKLPVDAQKRA